MPLKNRKNYSTIYLSSNSSRIAEAVNLDRARFILLYYHDGAHYEDIDVEHPDGSHQRLFKSWDEVPQIIKDQIPREFIVGDSPQAEAARAQARPVEEISNDVEQVRTALGLTNEDDYESDDNVHLWLPDIEKAFPKLKPGEQARLINFCLQWI